MAVRNRNVVYGSGPRPRYAQSDEQTAVEEGAVTRSELPAIRIAPQSRSSNVASWPRTTSEIARSLTSIRYTIMDEYTSALVAKSAVLMPFAKLFCFSQWKGFS